MVVAPGRSHKSAQLPAHALLLITCASLNTKSAVPSKLEEKLTSHIWSVRVGCETLLLDPSQGCCKRVALALPVSSEENKLNMDRLCNQIDLC